MGKAIEGRIVAAPSHELNNRRGFIVVDPVRKASGATAALRVRIRSEFGTELIDFRAVEGESEVVEVPTTTPAGDQVLRTFPGSVWFYGENGETLGFLFDQNAGAYALPNATPRPLKGFQGRQKLDSVEPVGRA